MSDTQPDRPINLGELAAESPEESTRGELDAVDDVPDSGGLTPSDDAQHDPDSDQPGGDSAGLLRARLPFGVDPS